jgi:hypothetical protein
MGAEHYVFILEDRIAPFYDSHYVGIFFAELGKRHGPLTEEWFQAYLGIMANYVICGHPGIFGAGLAALEFIAGQVINVARKAFLARLRACRKTDQECDSEKDSLHWNGLLISVFL